MPQNMSPLEEELPAEPMTTNSVAEEPVQPEHTADDCFDDTLHILMKAAHQISTDPTSEFQEQHSKLKLLEEKNEYLA